MKEPATWRVRPRQVSHPLTVRLRGSSDSDCFHQIFVGEEYAAVRNLPNVRLVLDLGANAGFASAYFLNCFPDCQVVAVEPDDENAAICESNLRTYGKRARVLRGAAWSECTRLRLRNDFGDGRSWALQAAPAEDGAGAIQAWDVATIIEMTGLSAVDLLKVDIEKGELAVFDKSARHWLPRIRNICIELHDPECRNVFFRALADFYYELECSGEYTICRNLRPR
ncbi:MAG TPA: FkbM family methyltransferase [Bryobacteraceae bacterium]|jgi:FkbM family methyltransferase|nr:FkbM family methyltransferase [Bryobacteraceae bacterium]